MKTNHKQSSPELKHLVKSPEDEALPEKRYKPTKETIIQRLSTLNGLCGFFDEMLVVFVAKDAPITEMVTKVVDHFLPKD